MLLTSAREWPAGGDWALEPHLSPGQYETINPYGTLTFDIPGVLGCPRRPPATPNPR